MRQCYEADVNASERSSLTIRLAERGDAERVAEIFNQGVEDRVATFETSQATTEDASRWIANDLVVVGERDGEIVGWAKASPYADDHHY
jgi:L-amino acid N-acyltransferase YncA